MLSLNEGLDLVTASDIKSYIDGTSVQSKEYHLVSDIFNDYMQKDIKDGTKEIYRATLKKVVNYAGENTKIESIDLKWIYGFESYLAKTQGVNGRAIFLRSLKAVCKYAEKMHLIQNCPFDGFQIKQEPTRKRCVPISDFVKFMNYETSEENSRCRDYFMLSFYLIGINVVDLLTARKDQIVDGRLEYVRSKTHKLYSIKIEPEAMELIEKHSGKNYLLDALDTCVHYKSFARKINEGCQSIGPLVEVNDEIFGNPRKIIQPIIPGISTYYSRHSWATFASYIGIPIDIISQALGHNIGNPTTWIYIKQDKDQVDKANRKVIDYVSESSSEYLLSLL